MQELSGGAPGPDGYAPRRIEAGPGQGYESYDAKPWERPPPPSDVAPWQQPSRDPRRSDYGGDSGAAPWAAQGRGDYGYGAPGGGYGAPGAPGAAPWQQPPPPPGGQPSYGYGGYPGYPMMGAPGAAGAPGAPPGMGAPPPPPGMPSMPYGAGSPPPPPPGEGPPPPVSVLETCHKTPTNFDIATQREPSATTPTLLIEEQRRVSSCISMRHDASLATGNVGAKVGPEKGQCSCTLVFSFNGVH